MLKVNFGLILTTFEFWKYSQDKAIIYVSLPRGAQIHMMHVVLFCGKIWSEKRKKKQQMHVMIRKLFKF